VENDKVLCKFEYKLVIDKHLGKGESTNLLFTQRDYDFVELSVVDSTIVLDIRYATTNNLSGRKIYTSNKCFVRRVVAERLHAVQQELQGRGLGLKIFDGYRPFSVQEIFWEFCPNPHYLLEPIRGADGTLVEGSRHSRGVAVDLTLIDLQTGQELEMPSGFDDFSNRAHRCYAGMPLGVAKNCKLLEESMVKQGFEPLYTEWWHFDLLGWEQFDLLDLSFEQLED